MDNFRKTTAFGIKGFSSLSTKQDKGHNEQFKRLVAFNKTGGLPIIPLDEIINITKASIAALVSLKESRWVTID